jgi:cyclophilin family peptidyl-prolyl cis-trans isomerase
MVAHPYDSDRDYSATMKTGLGEITFDLLEDVAPDHVRNFVDLARQGYYAGTLFHKIAKGEVIMGGSTPEGDPRSIPYIMPPELSTLPHERGTLCSVRTGGPDNPVQFFIDLRRQPEFDGNFTIFGKLTAGEDTLKKLEDVATSGNNYQPFFKPIEDVVLRSITILERPRQEASGEKEQGEDVPNAGGSSF